MILSRVLLRSVSSTGSVMRQSGRLVSVPRSGIIMNATVTEVVLMSSSVNSLLLVRHR